MKSQRLFAIRIGLVIALVACLLSAMLACSSQEPASQTTPAQTQTSNQTQQPTTPVQTQTKEKPIELKIAHMEPTTHFLQGVMERFAKQVEEQTNGKVHFTIYPAGTLCNPPELFSSVKGGIADIGVGTAGYDAAQFPLNALCTDYMHNAVSSKIGTQMYTELFNSSPELQAEFSGTKILWLAVHSPGNIHTTFPVASLADLKNREIRYPGSLSPVAKALGMVPVSMPMSDTFMSIQKGIVEGCTAPTSELKGHRFAEVTKYTLMMKYYVGQRYTIMNPKTWESLPEDVKTVINNLKDWGSAEEAKGWDDSDAEAIEFAKAYQHEYIELTPEMSAEVAKIFAEVDKTAAAAVDAKGKPGTALLAKLYEIEAKYSAGAK